VFTAGVAIFVSALTVFYRDIGNVSGHFLRIWFYLSPALYGADRIAQAAENQPQLVAIYNLNPFVALFESYRNLIYHGQPPVWDLLALVLVESVALVFIAIFIFRRLEPSFAKVL
jgi:ABC-type polysaccharide/polyol phosphate export permease